MRFEQIPFALETNTYCALNKYILRLKQIHWSPAAPDPWPRPPIGRIPPHLIGQGSDTQSILLLQGWTGFSWALYILQWKQMYFEMRENTLVSVFCIMREEKKHPSNGIDFFLQSFLKSYPELEVSRYYIYVVTPK